MVSAYHPTRSAGALQAWPNPADNLLQVYTNGKAGELVTLLDATGRIIATQGLDAQGHAEFDVSTLASGVYLVQYQDGTQMHSTRITRK